MGSFPAEERLDYPEARRDETVVDNYHGVLVHDPYRWLEDPGAKEVKDFVEKQVSLTESLLQTCETRGKLRERITTLSDHPKYGCPRKRGDKYFYTFNTGLQAQSVLYIQENLEAEAEVLLDPNTLSEDGTTALYSYAISENVEFLAVGLSASGSDWVNIKVIRVADKSTEPDSLSWVKFSSITWTHDNKGFFYSRYPAPKEEGLDAGTEININLDHQLFYHFLGTNQSEDILCWKDSKHPKWKVISKITEDGKVFIPSKDRTQIPMFIVSKKDIALDGSHPALLYGYGGFNYSVTPRFNIAGVVISRHLGAVFAIANIRGGGEYGEEWHRAGSLAKKQNCFDDFISAAEFLVSEGYTQPKKLCIEGGSNGGLLVAACTNQTMQYVLCKSLENSPQTNPIIGRIDTKSGHGAGKPTQKVIDEEADKYAFMAKVVGAPWID